ncbi:hypothetical protein BV25DRAFT_1819834 [Artomyces pyxidatus]|uniref:Uncharacterized protein n=1 Tax=Artomyces pyxidatus TaxID=48021 RepID=A0ACB8TGF9_9AGAM|nr:hypothetical protein BV25DRAFT_1819834 [Artomyces pyxidatus]
MALALTLIAQGAEAKVYRARLHADRAAQDVLLKHRFHKQYRHASLDASLTRSRVAGEARALIKCLRSGVSVPGIRMVDAPNGLLAIEWIQGSSVRFLLGSSDEPLDEPVDGDLPVSDQPQEHQHPLEPYGVSQDALMVLIGVEIAKMHLADVIHGDLTTSNMMLRLPSSSPSTSRLVLIDFGLAYTSSLVEDKAVDLYVLERAFASTHPDSEPLFTSVLNAYQTRMGKQWHAVARRLDEVRLRGRKRSMVG